MSSNFGQIGPPTTELVALERLRNIPIDLIRGKWCFHFFSVVFDWILLILSCNKNKHESLDEFEFFEMRFDLGTLDSGERSLPFGLLVKFVSKISRKVFELGA